MSLNPLSGTALYSITRLVQLQMRFYVFDFSKIVKERNSVPLKQIIHDPMNIQTATAVSSILFTTMTSWYLTHFHFTRWMRIQVLNIKLELFQIYTEQMVHSILESAIQACQWCRQPIYWWWKQQDSGWTCQSGKIAIYSPKREK